MALGDHTDSEKELRRQVYRLDSVTQQLEQLRVAVSAWPAALLALLALLIPLFETSDDAEGSAQSIGLFKLAGEAANVDNGAVQAAAVVLSIALALLVLACVAVAITRRGQVALATYAVAGVAIVTWLILTLNVGSAGDGGVIGDLGYENTIRTLLVPLGPGVAVVAANIVRSHA